MQRGTPFPEVVEKAVNYCIRNGILADFLSKNRVEAIAMSIFEYDEEKHAQSEREEWREKGRTEGHTDLAQILKNLMDAGKTKEMERALTDGEYREQLCRKYSK